MKGTPNIIMSWHEWQSDTSDCAPSRLARGKYWNSNMLMLSAETSKRSLGRQLVPPTEAATNPRHVRRCFTHIIPPALRRFPRRHYNSRTLKNTGSIGFPVPNTVKRTPDVMHAAATPEERESKMLKSIIERDLRIRVAVQQDQKSRHDPFVIEIKYEIANARMSDISVDIADSLKYTRKDLHLQEISAGIVAFNWIATIPLAFVKYPVVTLVLNNEKHQHEVRKGNFEIKAFHQSESYMIGVTFVDTLYKDYYFARTQTAEIMNRNVIDQLARLENMLNVSCLHKKKKLDKNCSHVIKLFCMCDNILFRNDKCITKRLASCRLDIHSTIIDDMSCAEEVGSEISGNVSREDVVDTIIFDKILYLQEERYEENQTDAYSTICEVYEFVITLGSVALPFVELCQLLAKYKSLKQLANNLLKLLEIRCQLINLYFTQGQAEVDSPIFHASLMCVDNCILHNIDALCGTKKYLHGVCLFQSIVLRAHAPTTRSDKYRNISQEAMKLRTEFDHSNVYGQTLQKFAYKKTSVCRQMWKLTVCASMNYYLRQILIPHTNPIHMYMMTIPQPETFQFIFEPDSTMLYKEGKYREMLRMILETHMEITEEQKNLIMTYATDTSLTQISTKAEMKVFLDANDLIWYLMTMSNYTTASVLHSIDTMWEQLCSRTH